jgi:tRNA(Ile)-lysidine synthase TilS/MesJ
MQEKYVDEETKSILDKKQEIKKNQIVFILFISSSSMKKKCIVMFSGGLDSRLAVKIMQEQDFDILALFFKLPFGTGCCSESCSFNFSQLQGINLKIFDCTKGKLLQEYLEVIRNPKHRRGAGINPCIDCRIFMLKKAKEFADKKGIEIIVTGEVLGERPMSQTKKAMDIIEKESGLKGRLLRPLSAKLLPLIKSEIIDRKKIYDIHGRRREKQIALAKKFKISYPDPAGGCLLCEKELKNRLKYLIDKGMNEDEIKLVGVGRHFIIDKCWVVLGRDERENKIIESVGKKHFLVIPDFAGPSAVIFSKSSVKKKIKEKVNELIKAYSKKGNLKDRKKFEKLKL